MFAPEFDYHRATSVAEAVELLSATDGAKLIAGGHSLIPLLKLRLARPVALIDIGGINDLKTIAVEHGTDVAGNDGEYSIEAVSADIDRHFQQAGRLLGNGLHMDYWRAQGDRDADEVKVEAIVLAQDHEGMKRLETFAEDEFDALYAKHKRDIAKLKEQRRQHFQRLRLATSVPQTIPWALPETIDFNSRPSIRRESPRTPLRRPSFAFIRFLSRSEHGFCQLSL